MYGSDSDVHGTFHLSINFNNKINQGGLGSPPFFYYITNMKEETKELLYKIFVVFIGTGCMMVGPFFINMLLGKILAILGLCLLTIQTQKTKSYNLSLLNAVGIVGYLYSIFTQ